MPPKPFRGAFATTGRAVLNRQPCAVWIAAIAAQSSLTEAILANVYEILVLGEHGAIPESSRTITMEAFESLFSFQMKRDFLLAAAKHRFSADVVKRFGKKLKKVQNAYVGRNDAVHGRWGLNLAHPDELIWTKPITDTKNAQLYNEDDFIDVLERLETASDDLFKFFVTELKPKLKVITK